MPVPRRSVVATALTALFVTILLTGCGREEFPDRRALVDVDGRRVVYEFDEGTCGLDEDTIFLLGRAEDGGVLQAVVGLDESGRADPGATGITVSDGASDLGAFGPRSWDLRGGPGDPPGEISDASLRGARIRIVGTMQRLDPSGTPMADGEAVPVDLDARCDEADD